MAVAVLRRLTQSKASRDALTLMSGTALSQLIPIAVSPLLTRMYSAAEMGHWATFVAVASVAGILVDLRFSLAIVLADTTAHGFALLCICVAVSLAVSVLLATMLLTLLIVFGRLPFHLDHAELLPLAVLALGLNQSLYSWSNRQLRYRLMAKSKIAQSSLASLVAVAAGWLYPQGHYNGLICGYVFGTIAGVSLLVWGVCALDRHLIRDLRMSAMPSVAHRYRRFPILGIPADLVNVTTNQLPVFMLGYFHSSNAVGLFSLTLRVLVAPISLIARAVQDVFKDRASRDFVATGTCRRVFRDTLWILLALSIPIFIGLALVAPELFARAFGEQWREAGVFCRYLAPLFILRFAATPLSYVLYLADRQWHDLLWQITLFFGALIALVLGGLFFSVRGTIGLYSAVYSCAYVVYIAMSYRYAKGDPSPHSAPPQTHVQTRTILEQRAG